MSLYLVYETVQDLNLIAMRPMTSCCSFVQNDQFAALLSGIVWGTVQCSYLVSGVADYICVLLMPKGAVLGLI